MSGIYIHIPFCKQACHYCDFHFSTSMGKKEAMVSALSNELELRKGEFADEIVETIYFGGGTPSVLTSKEIGKLVKTVHENYSVTENPEITLEANPDDLTSVSLRAVEDLEGKIFQNYRKAGINRLSIGIQSFFEEDLQLMNRAHNAIEAEECIAEAIKHFDNISIDLIYGIPGMSNDRWKQNIAKAISFDIPHMSSYALTVEANTALAHMIKNGKVADVDDESTQQQFHILVDRLEAAGFINYEISNFGKEDYFASNNTGYWLGEKYMGIGPSAHSFNGLQRGWNVRNNTKYIKAIEAEKLPIETETLSTTDQYNEYVMTGLRTIWGVSLSKIANEFGQEYRKYIEGQSQKKIDEDLLLLNGDTLLTTKKGKFLVDGIAADLFVLNLD